MPTMGMHNLPDMEREKSLRDATRDLYVQQVKAGQKQPTTPTEREVFARLLKDPFSTIRVSPKGIAQSSPTPRG